MGDFIYPGERKAGNCHIMSFSTEESLVDLLFPGGRNVPRSENWFRFFSQHSTVKTETELLPNSVGVSFLWNHYYNKVMFLLKDNTLHAWNLKCLLLIVCLIPIFYKCAIMIASFFMLHFVHRFQSIFQRKGTIIMHVLEMGKQKHWEVKQFAQGDRAN